MTSVYLPDEKCLTRAICGICGTAAPLLFICTVMTSTAMLQALAENMQALSLTARRCMLSLAMINKYACIALAALCPDSTPRLLLYAYCDTEQLTTILWLAIVVQTDCQADKHGDLCSVFPASASDALQLCQSLVHGGNWCSFT